MRVAHLTIAGMTAVHAVRAIYTSFAGVPGISRAEVVMGGAEVEHDGSVTREMLANAITLAGYELVDWREERRLPTL